MQGPKEAKSTSLKLKVPSWKLKAERGQLFTLAYRTQPRIGGRFASKNTRTSPLPPSSDPSESTSRSATPDSLSLRSHQSTPITSPPPQAPVSTISTISADPDMSHHIEPFWGDRDDENPQDFLRSFNRAMGDKPDVHKMKQFINYLHADSVADDWYGSLDAAILADWALIEAEFHTRWPKTAVVKKTSTEYEEELLGLRLKEEELGKKETIAGREAYTHLVWADKMQKLVKGAGVETGTIYIGQVRKMLPSTIKDKVGDKHANWTAFLKAVRDVDIEYIKDEAEELKKKRDAQRAIEARLRQLEAVPASPTAGIRRQMTQASITTGSRGDSNGGGGNPFEGGTGGRGNLFAQAGRPYTAPTRQPATPAEQAALRVRIAGMPQHPDTQAGKLAHQGQQQMWAREHGAGTRVSELTPYPLRPGTAPVNSGECYKCGHTGHIGGHCPVPQAQQLHPNESRWRAICAYILREPRAPVGVRIVAIDDYGNFATVDSSVGTVDSEEQGKGEGPSA